MQTAVIKQYWTRIPAWIFIGTALVLLPIFTLITVRDINRQKENMTRVLVEKGAALIRSFEAGTRTGMRGRMHRGFKLEHLLKETARQADIVYLLITDDESRILAHSDSGRIGQLHDGRIDAAQMPDVDNLQWRWIEQDEGQAVFEVYRRFLPSPPHRRRPREHMRPPEHMRSPEQMRPPRQWPPAHSGREPFEPPRYIFVGLDAGPIAAARQADIRHTVVMGVILLLVGAAGILLLFLAQSYRSARLSLSRIKAFSDNLVAKMPIGLVALDTGRRIASFNDIAQSILGFTPEKALGRQARQVLPAELWQVVQQLEAGKESIEEEIECALAGGSRLPVAVSASTLRDENGAPLGLVLLLKDLREIEALRKLIQRNQRLVSVGRLAAGVAHEIRNPLSSIKGFATYFRERHRDKPEDLQIASIMIQEVDRLNRVIGQLLDFARPVKITRKPVAVKAWMEKSAKMIERQAAEKNVAVETLATSPVETVWVDVDRLNQVLLNLQLNALEAMEAGGRLTIEAGLSDDRSDEFLIRVRDTGCGIAPEELGHIFDPYYTTKPAGTGLGLAIAYNIVEAHGGRITVQSRPGQGTVCTIFLPNATGEQPA